MTVSRRRFLEAAGLTGLAAGVVAALRSLAGSPAPRPRVAAGVRRVVEPYGSGPLQRGEWWVPADGPPRLPTVVLVHGGFWGPQYDRSLEDAVAADLSGRGMLCWNIDYAAADRPWPATLTDVAAGYDHLTAGSLAGRVDPQRVAVVGHSAGGHLVLWLAGRPPAFAPAAGVPRPALVVAQAPVAALALGSRTRLGGGAVDRFVGGPPDRLPERYALADPLALLPTGVRTVLVHGTEDAIVPIAQSEAYLAAAGPERTSLQRFAGGHFEHLDPAAEAVAMARAALATM